jgi:uncharacterized protein YkwD
MMAQPVAPPRQPPAATPDQIKVVAELVNEHRKTVGCKALTWLSPVAAVAQRHSEDMAVQGFFSHTNLQGESPFDRLQKAGIRYQRAAENIAAGQNSAQQVVQSWLQSAGHRRNIEDCKLQQHGIGLFQNTWTHMFVTLP